MLTKLIKEDNVDELTKILISKEMQHNFNVPYSRTQQPLLLFAVEIQSIKVVEYLLSQDFVDKFICNSDRENIYHIVCSIRGKRAEKLFSIIESKVSHLLLLNNTNYKMNAFQIACHENATLFIVKRIYEIMKNLKVDLIDEDVIFDSIRYSKFNKVVWLLNAYLYQSIPSHLRNQFHILNKLHYLRNNIKCNNNTLIDDKKSNIKEEENDIDIYEEKIFKKIMKRRNGNRIWFEVCENHNFDVVHLIFSLSFKSIRPEIVNREGLNLFLFAIDRKANIKVIKYIYKLFPALIHSQIILKNEEVQNAASLVVNTLWMKKSHRLETLHFLYLKGIDIHLLSKSKEGGNQIISLYSQIKESNSSLLYLIQYFKVISQDFDYLHNEHDDTLYRKPSFWKEIDNKTNDKNTDKNNDNNNNNNNNNSDNNSAYEQLKRVNEWKNRFEEHVLHHLSKMIQEHMLLQKNVK